MTPTPELQLLREIRSELRTRLDAIERELHSQGDEIRLLAHEQQRLGCVVGEAIARRPTGVHADTWGD